MTAVYCLTIRDFYNNFFIKYVYYLYIYIFQDLIEVYLKDDLFLVVQVIFILFDLYFYLF